MTMMQTNASVIEFSAKPAQDAAAAAIASGSRPRILIVDDIADNRDILVRRLERHGFDFVEADGGKQALKLIDSQRFDLVLLDVVMPDLNGIEVLKRVRQDHSQAALPVIMVTANAESRDVVEALSLGANDYVTKPVNFAIALARINTQLGLKRAEDALQSANAALTAANAELERRVKELVCVNQLLEAEIAHRERAQQEIRYLAHYDALTGLPNRVLLREQLDDDFARSKRSGDRLAVLFLDLDGFKSINDTLGHSVGDVLLKRIAERLRNDLRETDRIARLGGDEFAVVQLAESQPDSAALLAARLITLMGNPYVIDDHEVQIGVSIGIAISVGGNVDPEQLLKNADLAMYRAKSEGRGTYRFFEPEMDMAAKARRLLEVDLHTALNRGEFHLHYQPLINSRTGRVIGFEALMRWHHPQRGLVMPAEFVPVAEEMGLIVPLGEWALHRACCDAACWPDDIKVAVNISPVQFKNGKIMHSVMRALADSGLTPSRLELEITESVLMEKMDANLSILQQLRQLGIRICMDDFGTGYSSLSYLRRFRFDKVKIDKSFINDLAQCNESLAIIQAIVGLGVSFGLATTAEGVETQDQVSKVASEGCTEMQGFFFSPAVPAQEIPALLTRLNQEAN